MIAGVVLMGLGCLFLAVNVYQVDIEWTMAVKLFLPVLFIWGGAMKLWRHFTWPLEKLQGKPGKAGLLSGIFWLSLGSVGALTAVGFLKFLPTVGMYWPVVLLIFGLGKIVDFFRMREISRSNFSEIAGVIFIILFGLGCLKLYQLNVLILEQDPFWNRLPEILGIEELMDPVVEFSTPLDLELGGITGLEICNAYGDIWIEGTSGAEGKGSAELISSLRDKDEVRAKSVADRIKLEVTNKNGILFITPNRKDLKSLGKRVTTSLKIEVPDSLKLNIDNEYGDINVSEMKNGCSFDARKGDLRVTNSEGDLQIKSESESVYLKGVEGGVAIDAGFTEVDMEDINGDVSVITSHKPVRIEAVAGNLKIENRHDDVEVTGITGTVNINNPGGQVSLSGISGQVTVVNSKGDVSISEAAGPVNLVTAYGDVELKDLESAVDITARYSDIEGRGLDSAVSIKGQDTGIDLEDLGGDLELETSQRPVYLSDIRGSVNIQNDLGMVVLKLIDKPAADIKVESRQGNIRLELPPNASFYLNARVTNGSITSEFGTPSDQNLLGDSVFETSVGENGPNITLLTSGSAIDIMRIQ